MLNSNEMTEVSEEVNDSVHVKIEHNMKSDLEEKEGKNIKRSEHQCPLCDLNSPQITNHMKLCKVYSEFLKKTLNRFACTLCSNVFKQRKNMYQHLKKKNGLKK